MSLIKRLRRRLHISWRLLILVMNLWTSWRDLSTEVDSIHYLRKCDLFTFCPSSKQAEADFSIINSRLWTVEREPIDSGVPSRAKSSLHQTGFEISCSDIFNPNKCNIVDNRWDISMVKRSEHIRSSTGETAAKCHCLTMASATSFLIDGKFSCLNS